jgi:transcriptional regulator with XRE-family HTH domain
MPDIKTSIASSVNPDGPLKEGWLNADVPKPGGHKPVEARLKFLRRWRKYRRLTQERLAERAGISQGMVSQLEGGVSDYTGEMLTVLADALDCEVADLLTRDPTDPAAIWSIWDQIPPHQRKRALRALAIFMDDNEGDAAKSA